MSAHEYRKLHKRAKGHCTWCGAEVPRGRRNWCRQECVSQFFLRYEWQSTSRYILRRDKYTCRRCGFDDNWRRRIFRRLSYSERQYLLRFYESEGFRDTPKRYWVEIHHIIPKGKGGTNLLSNLETLCYVCHTKTFREARGMVLTRGQAERLVESLDWLIAQQKNRAKNHQTLFGDSEPQYSPELLQAMAVRDEIERLKNE